MFARVFYACICLSFGTKSRGAKNTRVIFFQCMFMLIFDGGAFGTSEEIIVLKMINKIFGQLI